MCYLKNITLSPHTRYSSTPGDVFTAIIYRRYIVPFKKNIHGVVTMAQVTISRLPIGLSPLKFTVIGTTF